MYYINFLTSYTVSSIFCAFIDFYKPEQRVKEDRNKYETINEYFRMIPTVGLNLLLAYPVLKLLSYILIV